MKKTILLLLSAVLLLTANGSAFAQKDKSKKDGKDTVAAAKPTSAIKGISETTKSCRKFEGLFTLYQDTANGSAYLLVKKEQLSKEFIYFSYIADGVIEAGSIRGFYKGDNIFTIRRYFNKIEFVAENTSYYFDKSNPLSKSADANVTKGVMSSQTIIGEDKGKGEFLVKADDLFLSEIFEQIKPSSIPGFTGISFSLGTLSKEKTKYVSIKSYPMNTDVTVEYVYDNPSPIVGGRDMADNRYVSIKVQHSLIEVPKNDFKPRYDDPRIGYFTREVNDMTSKSATPYKDLISRWNLQKKDPGAALSEPVEPIVWWIENTTPLEYRETIRNAALTWNVAFEAAGFKNAIDVKIQPDNADWDAGDIRYNVLRWTSSPSPAFGGFGPSFVNPRTGQILGADIMLEYIFITNKLKAEKVFDVSLQQNFDQSNDPSKYCTLSDELHNSILFGFQQLQAEHASDKEVDEFIKSAIYYLILHEMGHTLGLNHNMKASQLYSPAQLNDKALTASTGIMGSVMDYPCVNYAADKSKQGLYMSNRPGPYDVWAIEYGYSESLKDSLAEQKRLQKILSRSTEPALAFGNDADDMRSPGAGIDPRVMIDDMSNDAITYASDRIKLVQSLLGKVKERYSTPDQSYQELKNAYSILVGEYNRSVTVISRYIGGVYVDRAFVGQPGATKPFTPVAYKDQKRAMDALSKYLFGVNSFVQNAEIYNYLQTQRRSFGFFGQTEDPKIHDMVLTMQKNVLSHLLNAAVMKRITDSELYGNQYKLNEFMSDLTNSIFKADLTTPVNGFRQNLQSEYVSRLLEIFKNKGFDKYDNIAQANAFTEIKNIQRLLQTPSLDAATKNHRQFLAYKISSALEGK